jgi:pyruvate/2-oxoacid:ferredoxin oxidoreductase beta subunit
MLHWYFSECVNFTSKRLIHSIHRNHVITIFLSNLAADRNGNQGVQSSDTTVTTAVVTGTLIREI